MKKSESALRQNVIVDMNDFLLEYAAKKLGNHDDLAEIVYNAAKDDLHGLDTLFKDNGEAREHIYTAVGEGFLSDYYGKLPEEMTQQADKLAADAIHYLGRHEAEMDDWKNN